MTGAPILGGFIGLLYKEARLLGAWDITWPPSQASHQSSGDSGMSFCHHFAPAPLPGPCRQAACMGPV